MHSTSNQPSGSKNYTCTNRQCRKQIDTLLAQFKPRDGPRTDENGLVSPLQVVHSMCGFCATSPSLSGVIKHYKLLANCHVARVGTQFLIIYQFGLFSGSTVHIRMFLVDTIPPTLPPSRELCIGSYVLNCLNLCDKGQYKLMYPDLILCEVSEPQLLQLRPPQGQQQQLPQLPQQQQPPQGQPPQGQQAQQVQSQQPHPLQQHPQQQLPQSALTNPGKRKATIRNAPGQKDKRPRHPHQPDMFDILLTAAAAIAAVEDEREHPACNGH